MCVDKTHHYILTNDSIEALYCIGQYKQKADSISLISKQRFNNTSVLFKYNMYQIILVTMFLVSLFGVIFYHSFKKKQLASLTIQRLRERLLHNKYLQSEAHVAQKAEHIKMLEKELSEKTEQNSSLEKELEETKKYIVDFQHVTDTANALKYADEQLLSNSHVCQAIRHVLNDRTSDTRNLKEEEWGQLDKEVHVFYPEFKSSLVRLCKISEIEYRLCLLLKINIGLADIATLLNRSKEAVYSSRRRLYKKAFQTDGGADQWDAFVRSL